MMVRSYVASSFLGAVLLALLVFSGAIAPARAGTIHPDVEAAALAAGPEGTVSVLIHLTDRVPIAQISRQLKERHASRIERHHTVITALRQAAGRSQGPVIALLGEGRDDGLVVGFTPYWISNLIVAQVGTSFLDRLAERADVDLVEPNFTAELIRPVAEGHWFGESGAAGGEGALHGRDIGVTPGLRAINADRCWYELGLTGTGRLICGLDTGVDSEHPALAMRWRGYGGAHPPEHCWLDVLADTVGAPYDLNGHGTHTMGTMCGLGEATEDTIGVAWAAQWIAANAIGQPGWNEEFDNDVIACFEWIADPDGDPETVDDVPDVCQNSWGGREFPPESSYYHRCDDLWWEVIDNCEAAGVVVTFSAGNEGPSAMSCGIPADRCTTIWNTFAIGAIDATNYPFPYPIASFSSRGPSGCDEVSIKPEVVAPGVDVYSSVPGGGYEQDGWSGTSMAGPHVAGVVALMREIDPDLEVDRAKQILMDTAVDHGNPSEDHTFGWGVIDAYVACLAVMNGYGNLQGQVTDAGTGQPLEGARVSVPELSRVTLADAIGDFDLKHLPAGTYEVVADLFGYDPDTSLVVVEDGGQHYLAIGLVSQPRGSVCGVIAHHSQGIEGVVVELLDAPVEKLHTDPDGNFLFIDLPVRSYSLGAGLFGWLPRVTEIQVTEGETLDVELSLLAGARDDFELDQGWTIGAPGDSAYEGIWERDDPNATYCGPFTVQPGDDNTEDGVRCYVTHNQPEGAKHYFGDVDGGHTTLLSPVFDATQTESPILVYYRWFHSVSGYPHDQEFRADVSTDGGQTWTNVETFVQGEGGWERMEIPLVGPTSPTGQMRIRFVAEDIAHASAVVEAAVDDIEVTGYFSSAPGSEKPLVLSLSLPRPNPLGQGTLLKFSLPRAQEVDVSIYDTAGRLVRGLVSGAQEAGTHRLFWDGRMSGGRHAHSGVYFVRMSTQGSELTRKMVIAR